MDAEIIPLVVFLNESIGDDCDHVLKKHSDDGMDINCLSFQDFQTVCMELITPVEIVEYLKWRLNFYQNNGSVDISIFMGNESILLTRPKSGEAVVKHFLAEKYKYTNAKEMEPYVKSFQLMLHNMTEHVAEESAEDASYSMILFFSHFSRAEIKEFKEQIDRALESSQKEEYTIVGSLRNTLQKYVISFVSTHNGLAMQMDYLEELANEVGTSFDKRMQVFAYWESADKFRIDYIFRDASNQYLQ